MRTWFAVIWLVVSQEHGADAADLAKTFGMRPGVARSLLLRLYHAARSPSFNRPIKRQDLARNGSIGVRFAKRPDRKGISLWIDLPFEEARMRFIDSVPAEMNANIMDEKMHSSRSRPRDRRRR